MQFLSWLNRKCLQGSCTLRSCVTFRQIHPNPNKWFYDVDEINIIEVDARGHLNVVQSKATLCKQRCIFFPGEGPLSTVRYETLCKKEGLNLETRYLGCYYM